MTDYVFEREGRSQTTLVVLILIYAALLYAWRSFDAAWWVLALLFLPTLPALWDLWRNPRSGLRLTDTELTWYSGKRRGSLALSEVETMRFDTRWDFSIRVTAQLSHRKRVRLPPESTPPGQVFEVELHARAIPVERHHFRVF